MKDNTVKLSGHAKDRFIERYFALEETLDEATRQRLIARTKAMFTSLRVRKAALTLRPVMGTRSPQKGKAAPPQAPVPAHEAPLGATLAATIEAPLAAADATPPAPANAASFDPYVFGLVPIFQREGGDGLLAKLAEVATVDNLRAMAKAQQIVLPQQLRSGDATAESIRAGIVEAVAKRIKDRRAAAG